MPSDEDASAEAARSQDFRRFKVMLDSTRRCRRLPMACPPRLSPPRPERPQRATSIHYTQSGRARRYPSKGHSISSMIASRRVRIARSVKKRPSHELMPVTWIGEARAARPIARHPSRTASARRSATAIASVARSARAWPGRPASTAARRRTCPTGRSSPHRVGPGPSESRPPPSRPGGRRRCRSESLRRRPCRRREGRVRSRSAPPRRPGASRKPVITSSKMSRMPCSRVSSRSARMNSWSGSSPPMLENGTGSQITAARSSARERAARPRRCRSTAGRLTSSITPGRDACAVGDRPGIAVRAGDVGDADERRVVLAVVVALEPRDPGPARERASRPEGHHRRLGATGHEAHLLDARHEPRDRLGELDLERRRDREARAVPHRLATASIEPLGRMAEEVRPEAHDQVDVLVAVDVDEPRAPSPRGRRRAARP